MFVFSDMLLHYRPIDSVPHLTIGLQAGMPSLNIGLYKLMSQLTIDL